MYADAFRDAADAAGLEIIEEQTIADGDEAPAARPRSPPSPTPRRT